MTETETSPVMEKTRELCEVILAQPEFSEFRQRMDAFLGDEELQTAYRELSERGSSLQEKHQRGTMPDAGEVEDFEKRREQFLESPVARGFLEAQQDVQQVRETIARYVMRTYELGRAPTPEDFESCNCNSGCGCG